MKCNICEVGMVRLVEDLSFCPECSLVSSDIPSDKTIYDRSYCLKYERYASTEIGNNIDRIRFETVEAALRQAPLLDFGCGHGSFITYCRIKRLKADGFDINPHSEYTDLSVLFNGHQTVTFWDSLEHLSKPKEIILGLKPKYLFISTPNTRDFVKTHRGEPLTKWHHYYPGEHVHYFNERSLKKLLKVCGYKQTVLHYKESEYRRSGGEENIITIGGRRS